LVAATPTQDSPNPPVVVVVVDSDDEDTGEGITFKRQRVVAATTSHCSTEAPSSTYWEHPRSASSPHEPVAIEGSGERAPKGVNVPPAPELPFILQHALKSFQERRAAKALSENLLEERIGQSFEDFLAQSFAFASQVRLRAQEELEAKVREELEANMKEELACQAQAFANHETALTQELSCLRQSERDTKKRLFDKGQ